MFLHGLSVLVVAAAATARTVTLTGDIDEMSTAYPSSELVFWNSSQQTPPAQQAVIKTKSKLASPRLRRNQGPKVTTDTLDDLHSRVIIGWDDEGSDNVYSVTQAYNNTGRLSDTTVYVSTNDGKEFNAVTSSAFKGTIISTFYPSPHDAGHVIFVDLAHRKLVLTEDSGKTFQAYNLPFVPNEIEFNDLIDGLIYARDSSTSRVYVSNTRGRTWSVALNDGEDEHVVVAAYWSRSGYGHDQDDTLYLELEPDNGATSSNLLKVQSCLAVANGTASSAGLDITPADKAINPNTFLLVKNYMFFETGVAGNRALWVSFNRSEFVKAEFSGPDSESDYTVVDALEEQVFVAVRHDNISNLYISGRKGTRFSLSLESIVYSTAYNLIDFYRVESLEGVYIATKVDPITRYGHTVITFDKGGQWSRIGRPAGDTDCPSKSDDDCQLQLHLDYSAYYLNVQHETAISSVSAPGYILAVGNTGPSLSQAKNTYVSNDGGQTWRKAFSGDKHINILDHGGVLIAAHAPDSATYDVVSYSLDRGLTWNEVQLGQKLVIAALLTEPGETSTLALLWGYPRTFNQKWTIVAVDFRQALENRDCSDSDFEEFTPRDPALPVELPCVLGQRETFKRRKVDSLCVIGDGNAYDEPVSVEPCECVAADYECDYGFERLSEDAPCRPTEQAVVPKCTPGQSISITKGYRKVTGSQCVAGLSLLVEPVTYFCPELCPVGPWSDWSDCDLCEPNGFQFRERHILDDTADRDECPCTYERRACPRRSLENTLKLVPSVAHFHVNEPVVLAAVLMDAQCSDGNSFGLVEFTWNLGTKAYTPSSSVLTGETLADITLTAPGIYQARLSASNGNSTAVLPFDLYVFSSSAFYTLTYQVPSAGQAHSFAVALTEQFAAILKASDLSNLYRNVDDVSNRVQGDKAMITFRLLNIDSADGFFDAALTQYKRAVSDSRLDTTFSGQPLKAIRAQLTSDVTEFTTTRATPTQQAASGSDSGTKARTATAAAVTVTVLAVIIVVVVVVVSRRKLKRFEQTYDRLERDVMANDEDDEAMLMHDADSDDGQQITATDAGPSRNLMFTGGSATSIQADTSLHDSNDLDVDV